MRVLNLIARGENKQNGSFILASFAQGYEVPFGNLDIFAHTHIDQFFSVSFSCGNDVVKEKKNELERIKLDKQNSFSASMDNKHHVIVSHEN